MRRIPRTQRVFDTSLPISPLVQRRISPPSCLRAASWHPHLRTTSAHFSTTPTFNFLLTGKQDKKKHQASIRRWQKRLLGDSEPIGAHVDPYDPTSPVRIAPEEQGEEIEVFEDDERMAEILASDGADAVYKEATDGTELLRIGGQRWTEQMEEGKIAKEFEKLTMRSYTPMSMNMANEIENMTGTLYTLRDENLMMGQNFEEFTGKPYTEYSFGRSSRVRNPDTLRQMFHQAVVETYALKEAGKDLDMSKQINRGIYDTPEWISDVKLQKDTAGKFFLSFPSGLSLKQLLEEVERVPDEPLTSEFLEEVQEELAAAELTLPPTMDPATPAYKRAALVKDDDKKKFDFMSNRPVPRAKPAKPVEEVVEAVQEVIVEEPIAASQPTPTVDHTAALSNSSAPSSDVAQSTPEPIARPIDQIEAGSSTKAFDAEAEVKWRNVPLADDAMTFALAKRLAQLTGQFISDYNLTTSRTLGDIYHHVCGAAKPATAKVNAYINIEGTRQNQRMAELAATSPEAAALAAKGKAHVGELLNLGNVNIHRVRPNKIQQRISTGLHKEIGRRLRVQDLINNERPKRFNNEIVEGTKLVPEFGRPIAPIAAHKLKQRTEKLQAEWEEQGLPVNEIIKQSNSIARQVV